MTSPFRINKSWKLGKQLWDYTLPSSLSLRQKASAVWIVGIQMIFFATLLKMRHSLCLRLDRQTNQRDFWSTSLFPMLKIFQKSLRSMIEVIRVSRSCFYCNNYGLFYCIGWNVSIIQLPSKASLIWNCLWIMSS